MDNTSVNKQWQWQYGYRHRLWKYGHMAKLVHWQLWNLDHEKRHTKWIDKLVISLLWQYSYSVHQFALIPFSTCGPRVPEHDPMGLRIESGHDEPNPKCCLMSQKHICTLWIWFKRNKRIGHVIRQAFGTKPFWIPGPPGLKVGCELVSRFSLGRISL